MNGLEKASSVLQESLNKEAFETVLGRAFAYAFNEMLLTQGQGVTHFDVNVNSNYGETNVIVKKGGSDILSFRMTNYGNSQGSDKIVSAVNDLRSQLYTLSNIERKFDELISAIKEFKDK